MKNKVYISLFAVAVSSCVIVSDINTGPGPWTRNNLTASGKPYIPGGTKVTNQIPNWEQIVKNDKPGTLGAVRTPQSKLGGNPLTYAPSEDENFLRHLSARLEGLNHQDALKLQDIAHEIAQLRMYDYEVFKKYFESKKMLNDEDEAEAADEIEEISS